MSRIFLLGYMGSGKTTIGKLLAGKLNMQFIDLDLFLENRYHKTVSQIFAEKGEAVFRTMEYEALKEVVDFENVVISTGGGTPCFHDTMELMNHSGTTVYLKVSVEELTSRLEKCKQTRPLLKDKSKEELYLFITENVAKREMYYNRAAIVFDAEKLLTDTNVDTIVTHLVKYLSSEF